MCTTPLHAAVMDGNLALVTHLMQTESDAFLCTRNQNGETALHLAVEHGSMDMIRCLCPQDKTIVLTIRDSDLFTPFLRALQYPEKANYFLDIRPEVLRDCTRYRYNPLHLVTTLELAKRIYAMSPSLLDDVSFISRETPVHTLTKMPKRHADVVLYLLAQDTELLTCRDSYNDTPLSSAYNWHDPKLVEEILSWKPDLKQTTSNGHTVLHMIAVCASNSDVVTRVLQHSLSDVSSIATEPCLTPYGLAVNCDNVYSKRVLEQYETCESIIQTHAVIQKNCWPTMQPVVDCLHRFLLSELTTTVFAYLGLEPHTVKKYKKQKCLEQENTQ